jgi:hypothetical protein
MELNIKQFSNLLTDWLDRITDIFVWKNSNIWDTTHAPGIISYPSGVLCACANSIETIRLNVYEPEIFRRKKVSIFFPFLTTN